VNTQVYIASVLNRFPQSIRDKVVFFAPLWDSLDYSGIEPAAFTRASVSEAVWRDGAAHLVSANQPRFEYEDGLPLGVLLTTGESLSFNFANLLDDVNSLFWIEDGALTWAPTAGNIFDGAGALQYTTGTHYRDIVKFSEILSAAEMAKVELIIAGFTVQGPGAGIGTAFARDAIAAGENIHTITHNLNNLATVITCVPDWPTRVFVSSKTENTATVIFTGTPISAQELHWGAETI